jgi:hypothetical protein
MAKVTKEQAIHEFMMVIGRYYANRAATRSNPSGRPVVGPAVTVPEMKITEEDLDEAMDMLSALIELQVTDLESDQPAAQFGRVVKIMDQLKAYGDSEKALPVGLALAIDQMARFQSGMWIE